MERRREEVRRFVEQTMQTIKEVDAEWADAIQMEQPLGEEMRIQSQEPVMSRTMRIPEDADALVEAFPKLFTMVKDLKNTSLRQLSDELSALRRADDPKALQDGLDRVSRSLGQ